MADLVIEASRKSLARTTPGKGAHTKDDGFPGTQHVRIRSIPNITSARPARRLAHIDSIIFTVEGLHAFDDPRRALIHMGVHRQCIAHELQLRGTHP